MMNDRITHIYLYALDHMDRMKGVKCGFYEVSSHYDNIFYVKLPCEDRYPIGGHQCYTIKDNKINNLLYNLKEVE